MSAPTIVGACLEAWCVGLQPYLPAFHGHQIKALACLSYAMALARHCSSGQVCLHVPGDAQPASVRRRFERLLANDRLDGPAALTAISRRLLADWPFADLLVILDETPRGPDLRCMKVAAGFHKRVLPLLGRCYRSEAPPEPMARLVLGLLRQVQTLVPPQVRVTLLADRGLCWPVLLEACRAWGWHWVLRLQRQTRLKDAAGREQSVGELVDHPGQRVFASGQVFKNAGWLPAQVVACWPPTSREPWLLITDRPASFRRCQSYCKRTWCEESFRDEKSSGLQWQTSKVRDPAHAQRLVVLLALAMLLTLALGAQVLKRGWRKVLDPHRQRRLSTFQLGLRYLIWSLCHDRSPPCPLARLPAS